MSLVFAIIPARFASTRFPGKVLAPLEFETPLANKSSREGNSPSEQRSAAGSGDLDSVSTLNPSGGRSLLEVVWSRVSRAERIDQTWIATDDERVYSAAKRFGAQVAMTREDHPSGTDRIGELVDRFDSEGQHPTHIVNVQGDEPFVTPEALDRLLAAFDHPSQPQMTTLAEPLTDTTDLFNPNCVKVVTAADGRALYFSRSPIPYQRGNAKTLEIDFRSQIVDTSPYRKHQGIYAYTRDALKRLVGAPPSLLERMEGLEQLRALDLGMAIRVAESDFQSVGVDTPEDLERAKKRLQGQ